MVNKNFRETHLKEKIFGPFSSVGLGKEGLNGIAF